MLLLRFILVVFSSFAVHSLEALRSFPNTRYVNSNIFRMNLNTYNKEISKIVGTLVVSSILVSQAPILANAAVGEGDLPDGAMAFSKILKYKGDWEKLSSSIKLRSAEISDEETQNIKRFLKQLANEYSDMELLGNGIPDAKKADEARRISKDFRKAVRQCDDAASDKNFAKIIEIYPQTASLLNDYLSLLQDVPDEL